jgi:hypothetical protein
MTLRRTYNAAIVNRAPQSSGPLRHRPACALLALALRLVFVPALRAQDAASLPADTPFLKEPNGALVATLRKGASIRAAAPSGGWSAVTLDGWISAGSLTRDPREGFQVSVSSAAGENLRTTPNGAIVARLKGGALLTRLETRGGWSHVQRQGVMAASALAAGPAPATAAAGTTPGVTAAPAPPDTAQQRVAFAQSSQLALAPEGTVIGNLGPGAAALVLGHSGDWVHVQLDGWVRERDAKVPGAGITGGVTAAALRAAPERYVGATVEWRVQFIALRSADELRPDLTAGQGYLLTRGPLPEPGFVYVTVTPEQAARFRDLTPLAEITVRGVIRTPKSKFIGTPIIELVTMLGGL